ncbi:MAG TPA: transporter [Candidatus Eisenbacteria bacterium]
MSLDCAQGIRVVSPASVRRAAPRVVASAVGALLLMAGAGVASACSICRCGDPTFNALGRTGYSTPGFRSALDWERFDKDEGNPEEDFESQVENRVTGLLSYGLSDRAMFTLRVPYSHRELTETEDGDEESVVTDGFSDPELSAQVRLWSTSGATMANGTSVSLYGGVKMPFGENALMEDGERIDEHAQPGTGSTDFHGALNLLHLFGTQSSMFASAGYRANGTNDFDYHYGDAWLANLAYEHKLGDRLDGVLEFNYRHAQADEIDPDGTEEENTGGSLLYVTPKLAANLGRNFVLRTAAQIPTVKDLNGEQTERVVANVGMTYFLSH